MLRRAARVLMTFVLVLLFAAVPARPAHASPAPAPRPASDPRVTVRIYPKEHLRVLFVGDSLTHGRFASTPARTFRRLVGDTLRRRVMVREDFVGFSGFTSVDVLKRIPDRPFDLVITEIGTNDELKLPRAVFREHYRALLDRIRKESPDASVICLGIWATASTAAPFDRTIAHRCRVDHGVYRRLSDLFDDTKDRGPAGRADFMGISDAFHPNDAGHAAIARRVVKTMKIVGVGVSQLVPVSAQPEVNGWSEGWKRLLLEPDRATSAADVEHTGRDPGGSDRAGTLARSR